MSDLPAGAVPLDQHAVTADVTAWARAVLADSTAYPMGAVTAPRAFGQLKLVARVETHTWWGADASEAPRPHRGVSVYEVRA